MVGYRRCPEQPDREFVRRPTEQLVPLELCLGRVGLCERQLALGRLSVDFPGRASSAWASCNWAEINV